MKTNLFLLIFVLAAGALYTWRDDLGRLTLPRLAPPAGERAKNEKQVAPDFIFKDIGGKTRRLSDFEDKAIVLNFWASWCAPCVVEFPQMTALARSTQDKTIFIFLSSDERPEDIARFLKKHSKESLPRNVIIGWDKDQDITQKLYRTFRLPESYMLAPGRVIRQKVVGLELDWNGTAGQEAIERLAP